MTLPRFLTRAFDRSWRAAVAASAEALFPVDARAPDHRDTELAVRTEGYVAALPPSQRPLVQFMFAAVEWLTPVLAPVGPRYSRRSAAERLDVVERWRSSRILPLRFLGDGLRATLVMVYASHPSVTRYIGDVPDEDAS